MPHLTDRERLVLAALAAERGAAFAPVQVQKMFFLLDENVADDIGGRQFNFEPYHYGPFDKDVYAELDRLARRGLVLCESIGPSAGHRRYSLTPEGQQIGEEEFAKFDQRVRQYVAAVSAWVRKLSFASLVGSIYKAYPQMREKSIFVD